MKKIVFLVVILVMVAILAGGESQLSKSITVFPYIQDFEGVAFPPNEWQVYGQGDPSSSWSANTTYNHTDGGSRSVMHLAGDPLDEVDGWLVIPNVVIPDMGGWTLSFWSYNEDPQLYQNNVNYNQILISTSSPDPAIGNYSGIWSPLTVAQSWHFNQADLSPYLNQTIHIAFRYVGTAAHSWFLDDVRIEEHSGIHEFPWLENFESGIFPPYYWYYHDEDANNFCWNWNQTHNFSENGTCSAMHLSGDGGTYGMEEGWLISPAIQIPGPGYSLSFRAYNENIVTGGGNVVMLSAASNYPPHGQFIELTHNTVPLGDDWYHYEFDLSPWANQTICIAFLYYGWEAHDWYLDDVLIQQYDGIGGFPWVENFEFSEFPPSLWSSYDLDGVDGSWFLASWEGYLDGGCNSACHWFSYEQPVQDGWLVSPLFQLPADQPAQLSFWSKNILYPEYGAPNSVWLSTWSLDPNDGDFFEIWTDTDGYDYWDQKTVDLSNWAGQNVYMAFRMQSDSHEWYVDNARIDVSTEDITGPVISHYPMLNTLRDDIPYGIYAHAEDPAGVWYLGVHYRINDTGDWIWTAGTYLDNNNWVADIPAQEHGTQITYVLVAADTFDNLTYTDGYAFEVNDPVWLYYDSESLNTWAGDINSVWGLGVLFENPLYGLGESVQINKVTACFRLDDEVVLTIFATDYPGPLNLDLMMDPLPMQIESEEWIEVTVNLIADTQYFYVDYSGIDANNGFAADYQRYYPGKCWVTMGGNTLELGAAGFEGVWMLRAEVQTTVGLEAPVLSIVDTSQGLVLQWTNVGADYYRIEASTKPFNPDFWNFFDTTTATEMGLLGEAGDPLKFFRVIALEGDPPREAQPVSIHERFNRGKETSVPYQILRLDRN